MSMSRALERRDHTDRRPGPAAGAAGDGQEGLYAAVIHAAPSGNAVEVIVPNLWGLASPRTAACASTFTGSPGDPILIGFDETKRACVIVNLA